MAYYSVAPLAATTSDSYTYASSDRLIRGSVVKITLKGASAIGIVLGPAPRFAKAKQLDSTGVTVPAPTLTLAEWAAREYLSSLGSALRALINDSVLRHQGEAKQSPAAPPGKTVRPTVLVQPRRADEYRRILDDATPATQSLLLVPDRLLDGPISAALTRTARQPVIFDSHLTPKQRALVWWRVASGEALTVIGNRAALWLPWTNLRTMIVDEEDDRNYKEEAAPRYHARAAAAALAKLTGANLIFGSYAPSLETWALVESGAYVKKEDTVTVNAVTTAPDPKTGYLSPPLYEALGSEARVAILTPQKDIAGVVREIKDEFPGRRVTSLSSTTGSAPVGELKAGKTDTIVGTTALCRPWDVKLDVAAAVGTDAFLQLPDFRAGERSYQALRKLAALVPEAGRLLIQTNEPTHPAITSLTRPPAEFYRTELAERRALRLPPTVRLTRILFETEAVARRAAGRLAGNDVSARVAPTELSSGWQVLVSGSPAAFANRLERSWKVDVDPQGPA